MGALLAGLVVFAVLAMLVVTAVDRERDAEEIGPALTIGVWFAYLVHADTVLTAAYMDVGRVPVPRVAALAAGAALIAVGAGLFAWATRTLVRRGGFTGLVSTRLVTDGPYVWMRHPQDVGWATMLLGIAIAGRSPVAVVLVAVFAGFVSRLWRADERQLEERFGEAFLQYRERTPAVARPARTARAVRA